MPFDQLFPRSFTASSVRRNAPALSGVYGISNATEWIYIGETDNIQEALLEHLRDQETSIRKLHPTGFVYEICERARRSGRQDRLILEYGPAKNRQGAGY